MLGPMMNLKGYRGLTVATWTTGMSTIIMLVLILVFEAKHGAELIELAGTLFKALAAVGVAYQGKNIAEGLPGRRGPPPEEEK